MTHIGTNEERRPWRPGDGIVCGEAMRAPAAIPCGPPTTVIVAKSAGRDGWSPKRRVLCEHHAKFDVGKAATQARRQAFEELATRHWDEYSELLRAAVERTIAERLSP